MGRDLHIDKRAEHSFPAYVNTEKRMKRQRSYKSQFRMAIFVRVEGKHRKSKPSPFAAIQMAREKNRYLRRFPNWGGKLSETYQRMEIT